MGQGFQNKQQRQPQIQLQSPSPYTNPMQQNQTNPMQKIGGMTQIPMSPQGQGGKGDPLKQTNPAMQNQHPMIGFIQKMMAQQSGGTQSSTGTGNKGNF